MVTVYIHLIETNTEIQKLNKLTKLLFSSTKIRTWNMDLSFFLHCFLPSFLLSSLPSFLPSVSIYTYLSTFLKNLAGWKHGSHA
jgi:hypothetical protein